MSADGEMSINESIEQSHNARLSIYKPFSFEANSTQSRLCFALPRHWSNLQLPCRADARMSAIDNLSVAQAIGVCFN
jgi:hypothetical protein